MNSRKPNGLKSNYRDMDGFLYESKRVLDMEVMPGAEPEPTVINPGYTKSLYADTKVPIELRSVAELKKTMCSKTWHNDRACFGCSGVCRYGQAYMMKTIEEATNMGMKELYMKYRGCVDPVA